MHLRHPEVGVTGPAHHREPAVAGRGVVRDRRVAPVVERTDVVGDPRLLERGPERLSVPLMVESRSLDAKGRRDSTRSGFLAVLEQHLVPYFGRMQLDTIEPVDVDAYIAKKRRAGLSAATVNRQLNVLRRVCKLAVRAGKMRVNPVASVEALEEPDRRLRWRRLQPEEIGAVARGFDELILEADRDERPWVEQARVVFLVVYGLSLRRGEVLGLRWRSVRLADPERRPSLSVEAATVRGRDGAPKSTTSRRTLVLDEFLAGELFDHRGPSRYQGEGERVFCHPLNASNSARPIFSQYDGFRAILSTENGLQVRSRRGWNMSERVSELDNLPARLVLDGELVAFNDEGAPHWPLLCESFMGTARSP